MEREIKFRAWDGRYQIMIPQAIPYQPSIIVLDVVFNEAYGDKSDERSESGIDDGGPEHYCITDEAIKIMQFTGLKDKNGVEIYEGDICTKMISSDEVNLAPRELHKGVIVYHFGGFCYKSGDYYYPMSRTHGVVEVIGNIHQNPELL